MDSQFAKRTPSGRHCHSLSPRLIPPSKRHVSYPPPSIALITYFRDPLLHHRLVAYCDFWGRTSSCCGSQVPPPFDLSAADCRITSTVQTGARSCGAISNLDGLAVPPPILMAAPISHNIWHVVYNASSANSGVLIPSRRPCVAIFLSVFLAVDVEPPLIGLPGAKSRSFVTVHVLAVELAHNTNIGFAIFDHIIILDFAAVRAVAQTPSAILMAVCIGDKVGHSVFDMSGAEFRNFSTILFFSVATFTILSFACPEQNSEDLLP